MAIVLAASISSILLPFLLLVWGVACWLLDEFTRYAETNLVERYAYPFLGWVMFLAIVTFWWWCVAAMMRGAGRAQRRAAQLTASGIVLGTISGALVSGMFRVRTSHWEPQILFDDSLSLAVGLYPLWGPLLALIGGFVFASIERSGEQGDVGA